jgi:hypothetical protein
MKWLYLSFVGKHGFLGACYVQQATHSPMKFPLFGIKDLPNEEIKEIAVLIVPASKVPKDHKWHDRLLTVQEIEVSSGGARKYGEILESFMPKCDLCGEPMPASGECLCADR